jgi:acyl dehydratase
MPFTFNADDWQIVPARSFAELKVGEIFRAPSRTLTDAHASAFQVVSCDNHPIHYDVGYANRYGHSAPVVHGLQVLAFTAPGATLLPHNFGAIFIAFTELSAKFLVEVHSGDTLYSASTEVTVHNQKGELVLSGHVLGTFPQGKELPSRVRTSGRSVIYAYPFVQVGRGEGSDGLKESRAPAPPSIAKLGFEFNVRRCCCK